MAAAPGVSYPDVFQIKTRTKKALERVLNRFEGRKDIVVDPDLMRPLDRLTGGASFLKENGVDKIFKLDRTDKNKSLVGCNRRMYLVRPKVNLIKIIADQISNEQLRGENRRYRIIMVPRKLFLCETLLEQEGVFGLCELDELDLDLLPLDADIMSMEAPDFFKSYYMDNDLTGLHTVSRGLLSIERIFGEIPNIYCLGRAGKMCYELLRRLSGGEKLITPDYPRSEIGHMFLIDREVDLVTPLCTQVTYEGLLDDMFGIHCACVEFGSEVTSKQQPVKVMLTSQDQMYDTIRNRHFTTVFDYLRSQAQTLQSLSDKRKDMKSVQDMKEFVANDLRQLNQQKANLSYHIGACEQIIGQKNKGDFQEYIQTEHSLLEGSSMRENVNYIEESINKQDSKLSCLKLLCLLSLTLDGIPSKEYKSLKTQFVQSYGFEHMITFHNLKKVGLLREQEVPAGSKVTAGVAAITRSSAFKSLRKRLNLIPTVDVDLRSPCDMSYVFSGAYTPLSCKLVEQVLQREGFLGLEEITRHLPGGVHDDIKLRTPGKGGKAMSNQPGRAAKVVLVYFIGGCTYSEIAALRFLGKQTGYQFIIATTSLYNGSSLLETVMEKSQV
ncbi:vacuolar protein sorting-associated protein 33B-like [Mya arenaria]|uniref:vacuolar protein sorting-associated protein 33B-like n=1 Tax=Mya arenaria TaxID=6604 RepID=UPI0022E6EBE2|nr:vacuolar protein sorting-associated protein 33B-like [Mya arenaria]